MSEVVGTPTRRPRSGLVAAAVGLAVPVVALLALAVTPGVTKGASAIGTANLQRYTQINGLLTGCRSLSTPAARRACKRDIRASQQRPVGGGLSIINTNGNVTVTFNPPVN